MEIIKVKDYQSMSEKVFELILKKTQDLPNPILGLATGSTPLGMYQQMIKNYELGNISFHNYSMFNLDEYVGLEESHPNSYQYYMKENLLKHIDVRMENAHIPNGMAEDLVKECQSYEQNIQKAGRIDIQILGLGLNGHIGFNEPGTSFDSRIHLVELDKSTRMANARFFDSIEEVPKEAITMGIGNIMESKEILLLVSGESKAEPLARLLQAEVSEDFPASILHQHPHVTIIADEKALEKVKVLC